MNTTPTSFGYSYFNTALTQRGREDAIRFARRAKDALGFDTVVVTGVSGTVMGGVIAHALGVALLVIRKDDDHSTHSWNRVEGSLGQRWAFLDDLIDSGATRRRVVAKVREVAVQRDIETRFVGSVLYENGNLYNGNNVPVDY